MKRITTNQTSGEIRNGFSKLPRLPLTEPPNHNVKIHEIAFLIVGTIIGFIAAAFFFCL